MGKKCISGFCGGSSSLGSPRAERNQVPSTFAYTPTKEDLANLGPDSRMTKDSL